MKLVTAIIFITLFIGLFSADLAMAKIGEWKDELNTGAGKTQVYNIMENSADSASAMAKYAGILLTWAPLLGITFIIHVVIAGYHWLTAAGSPEKVKEAQKRIINAVIGLALFVGLYLITYFFVKALAGATGYKI